jgi:hypothetical protein
MSKLSHENPLSQRKSNACESLNERYSMCYSQLLVRFPYLFLLGSLMLSVALSTCFLSLMRIRPFDQTDFYLPHGKALANSRRLQHLFGSDKNLRVHQQMDLYPALDVIIRRRVNDSSPTKNNSNMLRLEVVNEVSRRLVSFEVMTS